MAMQIGQGLEESEVMIDINTTPLIDVMLVLLVMLIITIPIQMHAVKLDMPRPNPNAPKTQPEVVELMIDFDGTITWNGAIVQDLDELKGYLAGAAMQSPQPEMHLRPHKLVDYNHVALVLAAAQRLGVRRMGFVGNEQYLRGVEQYLQ